MRRPTLLLLCCLLLAACVPDRGRDFTYTAPMQMPAKPQDTARIVLYRVDPGRPQPRALLNNVSLGNIRNDSYLIRDVAPGSYELRLEEAGSRNAMAETLLQRAELQAGGEWFIEVAVKEFDCSRPTYIDPVNTGGLAAGMAGAGISLLSTVIAPALVRCNDEVNLRPVWPHVGHWQINSLLQRDGAKPLADTVPTTTTLPVSGINWRKFDAALRQHFTANSSKLPDSEGRDNSLLKDWSLRGEAKDTDSGFEIDVALDYLRIDESNLSGRPIRRLVRYTVLRQGDAVSIAGWQPGNTP
ncbi:hypothetical protein [Ferrovibrio sp.]|uniref:hypothetical protein n=1 Tax=Ferrovibrio sp. TaxID=1917215 RepID=UPI003D129F1E